MGDVSRTEVPESVEGRARPEPQSDRENERVAGPGRGAELGSAGRPDGLGRASRWGCGIGPAREAAGGAPNPPAYHLCPVREVRVQYVSVWVWN